MYFKHAQSKTEIGPAHFLGLGKASPNCKKLAIFTAEMKKSRVTFGINMEKLIHHLSFLKILAIQQHQKKKKHHASF